MKRLNLPLCAFALMLAVPALAQQEHQGGGPPDQTPSGTQPADPGVSPAVPGHRGRRGDVPPGPPAANQDQDGASGRHPGRRGGRMERRGRQMERRGERKVEEGRPGPQQGGRRPRPQGQRPQRGQP